MNVINLHRVLASKADRYRAVGWREVERHRQAGFEDIVVLRYDGDQPPEPLSDAEVHLGLALLGAVVWS